MTTFFIAFATFHTLATIILFAIWVSESLLARPHGFSYRDATSPR